LHRPARPHLPAFATNRLARLPAGLAVMAMAALAALPGDAAGAACRGTPVQPVGVAGVADGRTVVLADGRSFVLAGIEAPDWAPLAALAGSGALTLEQMPGQDRYGRLFGLAFHAGTDEPVQAGLLARGAARLVPVAQVALPPACLAAFRAAETVARTAKLGLWRDPRYAVRQADRAADLLADMGRPTLAEGRVVSVRESGGIIYINFGRRWTEALTVTVLKRDETMLAKAGLVPRLLANRKVRVRGWLEERNGPRISVSHPDQVEMADE